MTENSFPNKRVDKRVPIDSITLPFPGSRENKSGYFEYLLLDVSMHGAQIAIPKWVVNRERIKQDDLINFHIPFQFHKKYFDQGRIAWSRWNDALHTHVYGAHFEREFSAVYPVFISFETSEISINLQEFPAMEDVLFKVMKDSGAPEAASEAQAARPDGKEGVVDGRRCYKRDPHHGRYNHVNNREVFVKTYQGIFLVEGRNFHAILKFSTNKTLRYRQRPLPLQAPLPLS